MAGTGEPLFLQVKEARAYDPDLTLGVGGFVDSSSQGASATTGSMRYAGFTTGAILRPSKVVKALGGGKSWDLLTAVAVRGAFGWRSYRRTFEGSISFFTTIVF